MNAIDLENLFSVVREAVVTYGRAYAERIIRAAHCGRPEGFVTTANLHLFRQYRNRVSGEPRSLVGDALGEPTSLVHGATKIIAAVLLTIVLFGAAPARADFGELCKATPLDCYLLVPTEDHEAICGKALTLRRASRMTARMARRAAAYLERGNVACASELLEELIPAFMRSWPKAPAPNPPTFPRAEDL